MYFLSLFVILRNSDQFLPHARVFEKILESEECLLVSQITNQIEIELEVFLELVDGQYLGVARGTDDFLELLLDLKLGLVCDENNVSH